MCMVGIFCENFRKSYYNRRNVIRIFTWLTLIFSTNPRLIQRDQTIVSSQLKMLLLIKLNNWLITEFQAPALKEHCVQTKPWAPKLTGNCELF